MFQLFNTVIYQNINHSWSKPWSLIHIWWIIPIYCQLSLILIALPNVSFYSNIYSFTVPSFFFNPKSLANTLICPREISSILSLLSKVCVARVVWSWWKHSRQWLGEMGTGAGVCWYLDYFSLVFFCFFLIFQRVYTSSHILKPPYWKC